LIYFDSFEIRSRYRLGAQPDGELQLIDDLGVCHGMCVGDFLRRLILGSAVANQT
jgi:hypothetical protein